MKWNITASAGGITKGATGIQPLKLSYSLKICIIISINGSVVGIMSSLKMSTKPIT